MKILVIGSGGREHALVWKLAQSSRATEIACAPGNDGMLRERVEATGKPVTRLPINAEDVRGVVEAASGGRFDLVVVAPDNPLALGMVDALNKAGVRAWGPNQRAAQFEASKVFAQEFMERHGIPTARAGIFDNAAEAKRYARELDGRCAVKADGLALGKGVLICGATTEADEAVEEFLIRNKFGIAGRRIVVQELLEGTEVSLHALCDGRTAKLFPSSKDYKRAGDGDLGLNTGGMGTLSPAPVISAEEFESIGRQILGPWLSGCAAEGIDFRGLLYPGLMLTQDGPRVLEFNARFGDPETQVYLPRLESDLLDLLEASLEGRMDDAGLKWRPEACVCVVMASAGYPGAYEKGKRISGLAEASSAPGIKIFHAGARDDGGACVTDGGRVLGVTAMGKDIAEARARAYDAVDKIRFEGAQYRRDIAAL